MSSSDDRMLGYFVDKVFDDLMEIENNSTNKFAKYILQIYTKLKFFTIKSPAAYFDISLRDLKPDTIKIIRDYLKDCKTAQEKYAKLDGPMTEVIARITMQAKPMILSSVQEKEIATLYATSINQIRESVSYHWRFVEY
jgi:hypothetical protein